MEELRRNARGRIRHRERCEGGHRPYPRLYFEAIRDGHLSATKVKREGRVTKVKRDVLIEKASLDKWLKVRFYLRGGTDDLSMIALSEAAELAQCREGNLLHFVGLGELTGKENPEGRLVLDRAKFMVWLEGLPPHCDTLDPNVRWWTVLEIASLVQLSPLTVSHDIAKGRLTGVYARSKKGPPKYLVAEPDLHAWIKERSEIYQPAPTRGELLSLEQAVQRYGTDGQLLQRATAR